MIASLVKIANRLDHFGFYKEADIIEGVITKVHGKDPEDISWVDYIKEPGEDRPCLTPGAQFHINIEEREVSVSVDLPIELDISEDEAREMEDAMHDAMEAILAKYFENK